MSIPYYPINDFGPLMKGLVIGGLGIFHVFLAQFAIGGGFLMCHFQRLSNRRECTPADAFLLSYFKFLILVSFVLGALTGVGMWLTSIQISPRTIGLMVEEFHWIWAIEWTFFALEVVAGYSYYRYRDQLDDRTKLTLLVLYTGAAWMSLFWINGILSWQLTPGAWSESRDVWDGFFNPSFLPSLLFRTIASLAIGALVAMVVVNSSEYISRSDRAELIRRIAWFLVPMLAMPLLGAWYFAVMPPDSRSWVLGGSVALTLFLNLAVGCSVLIGAYACFGILWRGLTVNGATAVLLCVLAFGATAGGEFVREGARKPYTVRDTLYSTSMTPEELAVLRVKGSITDDPYPLRGADTLPTEQLAIGAKVFRVQCAICHTLDGVNGAVHLSEGWTLEQKRLNIAQLQRTKGFMPPFAGTAEEVEALVQYLTWLGAEHPAQWPDSRKDPEHAATIAEIDRYLATAGPVGPAAISPAHRPPRLREGS